MGRARGFLERLRPTIPAALALICLIAFAAVMMRSGIRAGQDAQRREREREGVVQPHPTRNVYTMPATQPAMSHRGARATTGPVTRGETYRYDVYGPSQYSIFHGVNRDNLYAPTTDPTWQFGRGVRGPTQAADEDEGPVHAQPHP